MKDQLKAPTMKDVAKEAGVALGTVSKVFNGLPVGEEYKTRVEAAAKRLGYQVNVYARGLRSSKTLTVALIIPNLTHPFFSSFADYCCAILQEKGYRMLLSTTSYDPNSEQKCIDMVQQNKVDGIIAITYNPNLNVSDNLPFVIIDRKLDANVPCVSSDNFAGGELAAEKLLENKCQKLLFLGLGSQVPGEADKRAIGFESYCSSHNVDYYMFKNFDDEEATIDGIHKVMNFIEDNTSDGHFKYDGIFCNTDMLACKVIDKLTSLGVKIPDDVQIIGYDGIRKAESDELYCSSIVQPLHKLADTAINLLLDVDKNDTPSLVCLPVHYAYGKTTKF